MDWTQIIITGLGILAGFDLTRIAFVKLTRKEKEIDVIKKLVDEVYKPTIEDLKGEVKDLNEKVDRQQAKINGLEEQVERISRERDECHKALRELTGKVEGMTAGRPARNVRTGRYTKASCPDTPETSCEVSDGDDQ